MRKIDIFKRVDDYKDEVDKLLVKIFSLESEEYLLSLEVNSISQTTTSTVIKVSVKLSDGLKEYTENLFIKGPGEDTKQKLYLNNSFKELDFYQAQDSSNKDLPIAKDHYSYQSKKNDDFLLVLKDLSKDYKTPNEKDRYELSNWHRCVETLAKIHAYFWNHHNIKRNFIKIRSKKQLKEAQEENLLMLENFLNRYKDDLDDRNKYFLKKAMQINIDFVKEVRERTINKNRITVIHGDSHIKNFIFSKKASLNPILVDYQFWNNGIGATDLAHLFRVDFPDIFLPELLKLVSYYHEVLILNNVKDYSLNDCLKDFRNAIGVMILIPFWQNIIFDKPFEEAKLAFNKRINDFEFIDSIIG